MAEWRSCLVTLIDLVGVKSLAPTKRGSVMMRRLHATAEDLGRRGFRATDHVYAFNDSVVMLCYLDESAPQRVALALRDAVDMKDATSDIASSYAVAVRGMTFPERTVRADPSAPVTVIRASSWALANCFAIEAELKHLRMAWYIDGRVLKDVPQLRRLHDGKYDGALLPKKRERKVFVFRRTLFASAV